MMENVPGDAASSRTVKRYCAVWFLTECGKRLCCHFCENKKLCGKCNAKYVTCPQRVYVWDVM